MPDWQQLARPSLQGLERYDPGPSRDALKHEHGLSDLEPLNWNEDLFGPPARALDAAVAEVARASLYPERAFADFRDAVAEWLGVPSACVIPGHGVQALIGSVAAAFVDQTTTVAVPALTYPLYRQVSSAAGATMVVVPAAGLSIDLDALAQAARTHRARVVWVCDPNNPTGQLLAADHWASFLDQLPDDCVVVADEAYIDFADPHLRSPRQRDVLDGRALIVLRSFSKVFGLAGLRLGYAIADPQVARLLDIVQEPFNVNRVALAAGRAAITQPGFVDERRAEVAAARAVLVEELGRGGLETFPSQANFVLCRLGADDRSVCAALMRRGVLVRGGHEFGLPGFARITVGRQPLMRRVGREVVAAVCATASDIS
jgi:histidinol-phosphate aminotransferase